MMLILCIFMFLGTQAAYPACLPDDEWDYGALGPKYWQKCFEQCAGKQQSPINIKTKDLYSYKQLKPFRFISFDWLIEFNVTNSGSTVVFTQPNKSYYPLKLGGSNLKSIYSFIQFHFHWGRNNYQGSEHYINYKKFPLELHLVFQKRSSIAVLAFLFKLTKKDNKSIEELLDAVDRVRYINETTKVSLRLDKILPITKNLKAYYRYMGSLTVPPCKEGVIWSIFNEYIPISAKQMTIFRKNFIKTNFRPIQDLQGRMVLSSIC